MAEIIPISPSLLNTWLTCPRQYEAKYITKEVVFKSSEAAAFGDRVHKSIELYLTTGAPLSEEAAICGDAVEWVKAQGEIEGVDLHVEMRLANTAPWADTPHAKSQWRGRGYGGIADVVLNDHNNRRTLLIDWKTGKRAKDDPTQAQLLALCAAARSDMYRDIRTMWVFVKPGKVVYHKLDMRTMHAVKETEANMWRHRDAVLAGDFPATPNGLCGKWCDVLSCPFNGRSKGE